MSPFSMTYCPLVHTVFTQMLDLAIPSYWAPKKW